MKLRTLFIINSIFFLIGALSGLLNPNDALSFGYYSEVGKVAPWVTRLHGAMFLGFAALCWFARNGRMTPARQAIVQALMIVNGGHFIIHLIAAIKGIGPALLWWPGTVIFLLFTVGYGYFLYGKPKEPGN